MMQTLINFLKSHYISVLGNTDSTITVQAVYSKGGARFTQTEIIPANMKAVRDWLGY